MVKGNEAPVRIASYNIRKCVGLDRRRDPARIMRVINELDPDIIALQEADRRLGSRPAALMHDLVDRQSPLEPIRLKDDSGSLGWHGNAVLVRKGTPISTVDLLDLPSLEPRGAVLVEIGSDDRPIRIVATHLGLTRKFRLRQLAAITETLATRTPMPTIILGDFNEWSSKKGLEPLEIDFVIHSPGRTFHTAQPLAALDKIAVCPAIRVERTGVKRNGEARMASDHLPIWADLKITDQQLDDGVAA